MGLIFFTVPGPQKLYFNYRAQILIYRVHCPALKRKKNTMMIMMMMMMMMMIAEKHGAPVLCRRRRRTADRLDQEFHRRTT